MFSLCFVVHFASKYFTLQVAWYNILSPYVTQMNRPSHDHLTDPYFIKECLTLNVLNESNGFEYGLYLVKQQLLAPKTLAWRETSLPPGKRTYVNFLAFALQSDISPCREI